MNWTEMNSSSRTPELSGTPELEFANSSVNALIKMRVPRTRQALVNLVSLQPIKSWRYNARDQ